MRATLGVALQWCDAVVCLFHECTDDSEAIVDQAVSTYPAVRIVKAHAHGPWLEMAHRDRMLDVARGLDSTHVAIIDADEMLTATVLPFIREWAEKLNPGEMLTLPLYNLRGGLDRYHANGIWSQRTVSVVFRADDAVSWSGGGERFHAREPRFAMGDRQVMRQFCGQNFGGVFHLWGASERRLMAKHALYKLTERERWPEKSVATIDAQYNLAVFDREPMRPDLWRFRQVPCEWWDYGFLDMRHSIDLDQKPWQEAEVRRRLAENPAAGAGLLLFGFDEVRS